MTPTTKLTDAEFSKRYQTLNDRPLNFDEIPAGIDPHHIWTQVEGTDDDHGILIHGLHVVDRIGYWITIKPWSDGDDIEVRW